MHCPRCETPMEACALDGHSGAPLVIDICHGCQTFWFDQHESPRLSPGSTLALFATIGAATHRPTPATDADVAKCPRCRGRLRLTHDRQRQTAFAYLRCPNNHGRLTTFVDFLKEKDFVKALTGEELAGLRLNVKVIHCSSCGATIDLAATSACGHCGAALSTLDLPHAARVVTQLQTAEARRTGVAIDPTLPLRLAQARREVDLAFETLTPSTLWLQDASSQGLVGAGLAALARWLKAP